MEVAKQGVGPSTRSDAAGITTSNRKGRSRTSTTAHAYSSDIREWSTQNDWSMQVFAIGTMAVSPTSADAYDDVSPGNRAMAGCA
ncbi:hypothetical protein HU200_046373 [Digitaria exilis]|uniref:Uncharacterized protein n=1 Tax=Digitaria exilis TaxID=1010633 RepID=A0A835EDS2_9POAL|nr:hypothetical protein HU200_046373 [Digitaria exilis]